MWGTLNCLSPRLAKHHGLGQDDEKGGLSLMEVAVTTETATTAETTKTITVVSWH